MVVGSQPPVSIRHTGVLDLGMDECWLGDTYVDAGVDTVRDAPSHKLGWFSEEFGYIFSGELVV